MNNLKIIETNNSVQFMTYLGIFTPYISGSFNNKYTFTTLKSNYT